MTPIDTISTVQISNNPPPVTEATVARRDVMVPWQACCIQAYIATSLHSGIRALDLVRVVQFSPNRFDRVFKGTFRCTPRQYVMRVGIARSKTFADVRRHTSQNRSGVRVRQPIVPQQHLPKDGRAVCGGMAPYARD
jgi:hypothetical protein